MYIELLFKIEYICRIPKGFGMEQVLPQLASKTQLDDSTGFDEKRSREEGDIMIAIVNHLDKD